ncbi:hypothetical protein IV203_008491 [Nitzschia inconspicua]|uniref:Uncharacterized protein n=1 Tax=Nitzschia inconspicua TaxID=303405 RepID=A0A9K3L073_9STRA|nr:hypothetical protein IV203_008491 [Nitzschia inconspicua]
MPTSLLRSSMTRRFGIYSSTIGATPPYSCCGPLCTRFASNNNNNNNTSIGHQVTGPTQKLKSWQSGARLVKNTSVENQYLDHIREIHDPSLHLKTIEDELKGTIGKALGKQGQKILMYARLMHQERQKYDGLLEQYDSSHLEVRKVARKHNDYRKDCLHARWELIVHRQAVGFIADNHKYVTEKFPIAEALPEGNTPESGDSDDDDKVKLKSQKKTFGDQLDWWQRIGRWR